MLNKSEFEKRDLMKKITVVLIKTVSFIMTALLTALLAGFLIKFIKGDVLFGDILNAVFILCAVTDILSSLIFSVKLKADDNNQGIALTAGMVNLIAFFVVWQALKNPILTVAFALCTAVPALLFIIELISQFKSNN